MPVTSSLATGLLAAAASKGDGGMLEMLGGLGIYIPLVVANIVVFLVFFVIIRSVLFERVRAHMKARDEELERGRADVDALAATRQQAVARVEAARAELEKQSYERTQEQVRRGQARKSEVVQKANEEALDQVNAMRRQVAELGDQVVVSARDQVMELALKALRLSTGGAVDLGRLEAALAKTIDAKVAGGAS